MYRAFLSFWRARFSSACTVPLRARQNALALGLAVALYPASCARADSIEQLRAFVAQVHAARGRFVQTLIEAPSRGESARPAAPLPARRSSGTFLFSRPGRFIWRYEQPYQQILQSDGKTFYIYDKDLNQVMLHPLDQAFSASPLAVLFGRNNLEHDFALRPQAARDGLEWLKMTPKKTDESPYRRILLGFRNGQPESMELHDAFGNLTVLTLSALEKNSPLPERMFKFDMPPGVDIIRE
ncbi:outer membrane lipoprotein chaperone LolA [Candidatus Glomeribacter gigasporarum]|uniref:outer membrane lipoprotein chaperone LolA n=1 Tax=Candidatus Glomeribacter gigasporarum TaxID=132144 RepID=UPI0002E01D3E|nr:outer membrane lipoprotein chaperone LolA [Candidatus Glomeribacter gigasporarum]